MSESEDLGSIPSAGEYFLLNFNVFIFTSIFEYYCISSIPLITISTAKRTNKTRQAFLKQYLHYLISWFMKRILDLDYNYNWLLYEQFLLARVKVMS